MAEPALKTCTGCGAQVLEPRTIWDCPACKFQNRMTRDHLGERPRVETSRQLTRARRHLSVVPESYNRPQTRAECKDVPRPCPYIGCRYSLRAEVTFAGSLKLIRDLESDGPSCSLDVADGGEHTSDEVAEAMNVTRARVHQIEDAAFAKLMRRHGDWLRKLLGEH